MSISTRDPQSKTAGAVKQGVLATAIGGFIVAFNPEADAALAVATLGLLQVVLGLAGSAARDWCHDKGVDTKDAPFVLWMLTRSG